MWSTFHAVTKATPYLDVIKRVWMCYAHVIYMTDMSWKTSYNFQFPSQFAIFRTKLFPKFGQRCYNSNTYINITLFLCRECSRKFWESLTKVAFIASTMESEPWTSTSIDSSGSSSPQVLRTHQQHVADYTRLMMGGGMHLTMGEDKAAPLIKEVFSSMPIS